MPPELLNRIYEEVMDVATPVYINCGSEKKYRDPALLLVCREIRSVALPLYYGTTKFVICLRNATAPRKLRVSMSTLAHWLTILRPWRAQFLRCVVIMVSEGTDQMVRKEHLKNQRRTVPVSVTREHIKDKFYTEWRWHMFELTPFDDLGIKDVWVEYEVVKDEERTWEGLRPWELDQMGPGSFKEKL